MPFAYADGRVSEASGTRGDQKRRICA
ncbi:MAG: hypothetical protein IK081_12320 [Lachnospiraceae bacterium]|nr:hypothetical protein [Lachnospiraceae bacterium]